MGGKETATKLEQKVNEWLKSKGSGIEIRQTEQSVVPETGGVFLTIFYDKTNNMEEGVD